MSTTLKNIRFCYHYADAGNNKEHGEVVFSYRSGIEDLDALEARFREHLFSEEFFYPYALGIPLLGFEEFDPELDHDWYYFDGLEWTEDDATDEQDIMEFLDTLQENAQKAPY
ncbi:MAG: hypothetical protein ABEH43_02880 [Flavobacteriales bacterium]